MFFQEVYTTSIWTKASIGSAATASVVRAGIPSGKNQEWDLFIHRNTLLYRLDRIKDILDYNFSDTNHTLSLQLALKLYAKYT
ncbi:helix-turn-helix domain-containing protein [Trichococcus sp.]|uniref:helix-turn-helix domain-containing protein n=1 Tax=Trichococcus sp. TaxID=1985464 RepID=UPI003C798CCB